MARDGGAVFTGIVEETGHVVGVKPAGAVLVLTVATSVDHRDTKLGDSIAVDGVCLTVTALDVKSGRLSFDVGPETLAVTALRRLKVGAAVHLERALRVGDRLGGHFVLGHVDGVGMVRRTETRGDTLIVTVDAPVSVRRLLIMKGSITIDGVSLTVNTIDDDGFSVWLIPHTLEKTRVAKLSTGDVVNLESDVIGKYVERLIAPHQSSGVTLSLLKENGFIDDKGPAS